MILPDLLDATEHLSFNPLAHVAQYRDEICEYTSLIDRTIAENAPVLIKEGGILKEGVSGELDYFRELLTGGENWLKEFEEREKERTGIKSLKIGFNKVFGYFIEISNSYLNQIPEGYVRKQTLTNGERFITEELKNMKMMFFQQSSNLRNWNINCSVTSENTLKSSCLKSEKLQTVLLNATCIQDLRRQLPKTISVNR